MKRETHAKYHNHNAAVEKNRYKLELGKKKIMFIMLVSFFTTCWYYSSSKCAIASQRLVQEYRALADNGTASFSPFPIMAVLTALQLFAGLAISYPLHLLLTSTTSDHSIRQMKFISVDAYSKIGMAVGNFHFFGCLCTNMGYAFGSASVVQVIKLLEPIETLLLTAVMNVTILKIRAFHNITIVKASSVLIIVFGTSLLLAQKGVGKHVNYHSVLFALISGFSMASRNVVKKASVSMAASNAVKNESNGDDSSVVEENEEGKASSTSAGASTDEPRNTNKVSEGISNVKTWRHIAVNGITNFASITIIGSMPALVCLLFAEMLQIKMTSSSSLNSSTSTVEGSIVQWMLLSPTAGRKGLEAALSHGMFNLASVSVLSLITAQSHSLLNVGKRICNVLYAAVVFHEPIGRNGTMGLCIAAIGGILYSAGNTIHVQCCGSEDDMDKYSTSNWQVIEMKGIMKSFLSIIMMRKPSSSVQKVSKMKKSWSPRHKRTMIMVCAAVIIIGSSTFAVYRDFVPKMKVVKDKTGTKTYIINSTQGKGEEEQDRKEVDTMVPLPPSSLLMSNVTSSINSTSTSLFSNHTS